MITLLERIISNFSVILTHFIPFPYNPFNHLSNLLQKLIL